MSLPAVSNYSQLNRKYSNLVANVFLAVHVCIYHVCIQCVCVTGCKIRAMFLCVWINSSTSHCELGKAIGRPGRVIKVKLLPPRLFLTPWWDNRRGSHSALLFHTRPAFLPALFFFDSSSPVSPIYTSEERFLAEEWQESGVVKYIQHT